MKYFYYRCDICQKDISRAQAEQYNEQCSKCYEGLRRLYKDAWPDRNEMGPFWKKVQEAIEFLQSAESISGISVVLRDRTDEAYEENAAR